MYAMLILFLEGKTMVLMRVHCSHCDSNQMIKPTLTNHNSGAKTPPAPINLSSATQPVRGGLPAITRQVIAMSLHASGVWDTAWVGRVSADTGMKAWRKKGAARTRTQAALGALDLRTVAVVIGRMDAAEGNAMWSLVGKKQEPLWRWHAIDHR